MGEESPGMLAAGSQAGTRAAPIPGTRLAGYRLDQQIGAGGMAVVYRATDERLGRVAALKVLAPALAADEQFRLRFIRESHAAAAVDDPHIIPVYEAGEAGGVLYIAMRYVAGGDLGSMLARYGPMPPARAAMFISAVASALDAAHAAGLVHCDVKPANMLVDHGDGRTDQYALACAAFQLLTGTAPFQRDLPTAVIWAHMSEPPPALSSRLAGLPQAADPVLARALAKAPGDRYRSCREFADALRGAFGLSSYGSSTGAMPVPRDLPVQRDTSAPRDGHQPAHHHAAGADGSGLHVRKTPPTRHPRRGPRRRVAIAAIGVVVLAGVIAAAVLMSDSGGTKAGTGPAAALDKTGTQYTFLRTLRLPASLGSGTANGVGFSPDGTTIATADSNGSAYLWSLASDHRIATLSAPDAGKLVTVAFSPGGAMLATSDNNNAIYLWRVPRG